MLTGVQARRGRIWATLLLAGFGCALSAFAREETPHRGGKVGWARLVSTNKSWERHAASDPILSEFIRTKTSLNLDPTWYAANPATLDQLCLYPLIFSTGLGPVKQPGARANLREYLERGGFLIVDGCINPDITPDPDVFLADNTRAFAEIIPSAIIKPIPATHEVYRIYFDLEGRLPHTSQQPRWTRHPLYGVYKEDRLVAVVSVSGLQCGWDRMSSTTQAERCMKMLVNLYVYAMTR